MAFGSSSPSSPINSTEPVLPQAGREEENAATPFTYGFGDWVKGGEGMTGESIGVQVQGERGRAALSEDQESQFSILTIDTGRWMTSTSGL
jgi:hypothetical protein